MSTSKITFFATNETLLPNLFRVFRMQKMVLHLILKSVSNPYAFIISLLCRFLSGFRKVGI